MSNAEVLERIADPDFQTELGRYNIELNVPPRPLPGDSALELEDTLRTSLNHAEAQANQTGAHIVAIGILPTVMPRALQHRVDERQPALRRRSTRRSSPPAARTCSSTSRGPTGERLAMYADTIAPESACTVGAAAPAGGPAGLRRRTGTPRRRSVGPQLALGANSPYFFGRQLWAETRIELFLQATDTRSVELKNQGVRPRVFFGERWITSIFDLFEENVRYFPALLPETTDEDPVAVLGRRQRRRGCRSCGCTTARSTAGTARSTTSSTARPTCGSRTACCRPAPPSWTSSPTRRSTTACCGCWPTTTGRSGPR